MPSYSLRAGIVLSSLIALSGCSYIHIGRIPPTDTQLAQENSDLRLEKKMLQQELVIARKEGDTLRATLEAKQSGADVAALTEKLAAATRELNELRSSYSRLTPDGNIRSAQGETAEIASLKKQVAESDGKLAASSKVAEDLREENAALRSQLEQQKSENKDLASKVQDLSSEGSRLRDAIAQLNTELLAQKDARSQAEQAAEAARDQLKTVLAQSTPPAKDAEQAQFSNLREGTASSAVSIESTGITAPKLEADGRPSGELRVSREKLGMAKASDSAPVPATQAAPAAQPQPRFHIVQAGDTLEKLAKKYYGSEERWRWIYAANNEMLRGGQPLRVGMQLVIPDSATFTP